MVLTLLVRLFMAFFSHLVESVRKLSVHIHIFPDIRLTGPGNCTILLAAKQSSTAVRGQYYGVAAAVGKLGAFVGTWGMLKSCKKS